MREKRGSCGGSFKKDLPYVEEDEEGLYVPGYRIAPGSDESYSELKIRSCPVANANIASPIVNAYYRHEKGILSLKDSYPNPTCAIVEAFDYLSYANQTLKNHLQKQAMEEHSNGK